MDRRTLGLEFPRDGGGFEFTGERYVPGIPGQIQYQHHHRYLAAAAHVAGKHVLDVACGEGYGSLALSQIAGSICGVDIATDVIAHAKARYQRPNLEFRVASITAIPYPDATFDVAICFETIEHVLDQSAAVAELRRVLKPEGVLIISSPNANADDGAWHEANPFHEKELTLEGFKALLTPHFPYIRLAEQRFLHGSILTEMAALSDNDGRASFRSINGGATYIEHHGDIGQSYFVATASTVPPPSLGLTVLDAELDFTGLEEQHRDAAHHCHQLRVELAKKDMLLAEAQTELSNTRLVLKSLRTWRRLAEIQLAHLHGRVGRDG